MLLRSGNRASIHLCKHPQTNGQAESANKVMLNGLSKKVDEGKGNWAEELSVVLWSYNITPQLSTGETPFKLTYGTDAMLPLEVVGVTPRISRRYCRVTDRHLMHKNLYLENDAEFFFSFKEIMHV